MSCDRCTYDQPHTHKDPKWVKGGWPRQGDPVRVEHSSGSVAIGTAGTATSRGYQVLVSPIHWSWIPVAGSTVFVESPPTPQPAELPTEPGHYRTSWDNVLYLSSSGDWFYGTESVSRELIESSKSWVRLEPGATTAKAVITRLNHFTKNTTSPQGPGVVILDRDWLKVCAEFGVTDA